MVADPSGVSFEEVFRFRPPTPDELDRAIEDFNFKIDNEEVGAVGVEAFFSIEGIKLVAHDVLDQTSLNMAEAYGVSPADAHMMVFAGYVAALEFIAAIRLRTDD